MGPTLEQGANLFELATNALAIPDPFQIGRVSAHCCRPWPRYTPRPDPDILSGSIRNSLSIGRPYRMMGGKISQVARLAVSDGQAPKGLIDGSAVQLVYPNNSVVWRDVGEEKACEGGRDRNDLAGT